MRTLLSLFLLASALPAQSPALRLTLPLKPRSVRFAVIGDSGTGQPGQYEVARQMNAWRSTFPFDFVLMLGDNIYGDAGPDGMRRKFELPYKPILDAGVKFYASLGNHDDSNERFYKPFNMGGKRYYTFSSGNVQFFALDSNYMDPEQLNWLRAQLESSKAAWKICFFHHPLYSHGKRHGSDRDLRNRLEPLLAGAVAVVFSGHDHVYERLKPQKGITYFVIGNSGALRPHNLRPSPDTAKGFDTGQSFLLAEIAGDQLFFQVISLAGETIDSGVVARTPASR